MEKQAEHGYVLTKYKTPDLTYQTPMPKPRLGETFLIHDSGKNYSCRFLIFGSTTAVSDMVKSRHFAVDGTFRCSPSMFCQLFTLHIMENNACMPRIFGLLSNKTGETYVWFFITLKAKFPSFKHKSAMLEFERAVMNALRKVYFKIVLTGRLFHLAQSLCRKITELGFKKQYETDETFNKGIQNFRSLTFLPENDVIDAFCDLSNDERIPSEIINYFELNYTSVERGSRNNWKREPGTFPIELLNVLDRTMSLSSEP